MREGWLSHLQFTTKRTTTLTSCKVNGMFDEGQGPLAYLDQTGPDQRFATFALFKVFSQDVIN